MSAIVLVSARCQFGAGARYGGFVGLELAGWGSVCSFAVRTAHFASCVAEAHALGHGPGGHRSPWGIEFQREACPVLAMTLSAGYLRGVANAGQRCSELMIGAAPEREVSSDWEVVAEFLSATAAALFEVPEVAEVAAGVGTLEIGSVPPPVLRYDLFAELLHPAGVARLKDAATAVARRCEVQLGVAPTAQELEWIISAAAQEPVSALAERNQTSTRSMYRRLEVMWARLGARNQIQGVAMAVQQGWIAAPPAPGDSDDCDFPGSSRAG